MESKVWLKNYPSYVPHDFEIERITLGEMLTRTAEKFPDKTALDFMGTQISYRQLEKEIDQFANVLRKLGVKRGDKVVVLLPNMPQQIIAFHSIWRVQAILVPCNPLYTDTELEYLFNDSGSTVLVTLDLLAPRMLQLRESTHIKTIITAHLNDYLSSPLKEALAQNQGMHIPYEPADHFYEFVTLMESAPVLSDNTIYAPMDTLAMLPYTGGTTGIPKGVILTHANISASAQMGMVWFDHLDENEIVLSGFPFFHVAGFCMGLNISVGKGWTNVLIPRPDPELFLNTWQQCNATIVGALPITFYKMIALPGFKNTDFSSIKFFISGGTAVPVDLMDTMEQITGKTLREGGGMTETAGLNYIVPITGPYKKGSCGLPAPKTQSRVMDPETGTRELPIGEIGELVSRGPHVMQGYYNNPEETKNVLRDGWLYTGDIARLDEDGYLYITSRKKDIIIASGYNIYPREIDEVLIRHPKVEMACAIGVPDQKRGETVKAFVVPIQGADLDEKDLDAFCREHLAAYKVPKSYEFVYSLPVSAIGKVLRKEVRAMELQNRNTSD